MSQPQRFDDVTAFDGWAAMRDGIALNPSGLTLDADALYATTALT